MAKHGDNKQVAASARKARLRNLRLMRAFAFVVILCTAFVAGFAVRSNDALLESLGFAALLESGDSTAGTAASKDKNTYNALSARVAEVEDALANDSLDSYDLDAATMSVLDAFADTTEDAYLRYYDPARYSSLMHDSSGSYAGVGVLFSEYNGLAYVVDVFDGSVAQAAGVRQGDFVVAIDGVALGTVERGRDLVHRPLLAAVTVDGRGHGLARPCRGRHRRGHVAAPGHARGRGRGGVHHYAGLLEVRREERHDEPRGHRGLREGAAADADVGRPREAGAR